MPSCPRRPRRRRTSAQPLVIACEFARANSQAMTSYKTKEAWAMLTCSVNDLKSRVGQVLGESQAHQITQEQVNQFADATGDHQWLHVDVERAKQGPYHGTIAHGFLTVSLLPTLLAECVSVTDAKEAVNYGL